MTRRPERHAFTVEEANALLPHVRAVLERLSALRRDAERRRRKLEVLEVLWGAEVENPENPDHDEFLDHRRSLSAAAEGLERAVHEDLIGRGIRFPVGGLRHGLVDFPTTLDGRWIYLCWRRGEPEVGHWHEVDGGYAGRRPITPSLRSRMARPDDPAREDDGALDF